MKVLFVCTVPTDKSGIPNVIFNLFEWLDRSNIELGYVSINKPSEYYEERLKKWGISLFIIPRKLTSPLSYIIQLAKIARDYDVVHIHGNSATMVLEMIAAKFAGVKHRIAHSHNTTCSMKLIDRLARPLFHKLCNGRLACGIEAGKWLFGERDFTVINNGIDTNRFIYNHEIRMLIRNRLNLNHEFVVGHIGNLVEQKNHRFIIDIFKSFHSKYPKSKLLLLGNGPLMSEIDKKVKNMGLADNVIFLGSVDKPEHYMNAMDLVIMPSLHEGLPLTLVEEQANGLPILAADSITKDSDMSGLVHFMSLSQSADEWSDCMLSLLANSHHNERTSKMAVESIKSANYDITVVCENLKQFYNKLDNDD